MHCVRTTTREICAEIGAGLASLLLLGAPTMLSRSRRVDAQLARGGPPYWCSIACHIAS
jgi:hypothetical protein